MNIRPRSFSVLYGIQRSFLNIFYLISVISVFWLLFYLMYEVLGASGAVIIPVAIVYLVLIILGYSLIQVISYIPANLAGAFDPVKNGIADKSIDTGEKLAEKLAGFMCSFFNFAFFDVKSAAVRLKDCDIIYSEDELLRDLKPNDIEKFVADKKETELYGRDLIHGKPGYIYVTPLIFGEFRLGYMVTLTQQKLRPIFVNLLNEFENDFVDDQVLHVIS
jgi:hypothetical protein